MLTGKFYKYLSALTACVAFGAADATTVATPRSATNVVSVASGRSDGAVVSARTSGTTESGHAGTVSRATTGTNATRRPSATVSRAATISNVLQRSRGRSATVPAASTRQHVITQSATRQRAGSAVTSGATSRAASTSVVRSGAVPTSASMARSASAPNGASRAGVARATAVFSDISKIGGGYASCREAYATCMDQFCALANDTYRRCFCSAKFTEFRDTEAALEEAKTLLARFEDNNLNAVNLSAAEVNAMYTATVGEAAIKNDTSGAAAILSEIGDLLSGKRKANTTANTQINVSGLIDIDDIWGGGGTSIFDTPSRNTDLTTMEGAELYSSAEEQCLQIIADQCESNAVLSMAKSAYSIMITQDCNAYEKKIESGKAAVQQTVRTAEKYLREARLDEYRAHNSADVNDCIDSVRSAMLADTACGSGYKRCLDYSGVYINQTTGEPIYSPRLFMLTDLIKLDGSADILGQNSEFNSFLETRKMFANAALDSCRDIAPTVWEEFKRTALIEISQAQDEKLEEVKMSCVTTMKECYDTQSGALQSFDDNTIKVSGALSASAARAMCEDKVITCASLYGNTEGCKFNNGKLTSNNSGSCGLSELVNFVNSVDDTRVATGCTTAIESYLTDLCTPKKGTQGYPWECRTKKIGTLDNNTAAKGTINDTLAENVMYAAQLYCGVGKNDTYGRLKGQTSTALYSAWEKVRDELEGQMQSACTELDGYWVSAIYGGSSAVTDAELLGAYYSMAFGGNKKSGLDLGVCKQNTVRLACLNYNTDTETVATYDVARDECTFSDAWYESQCAAIGGYYENAMCYVAK